VIRGNEIFWNNFNFHRGAPFKLRTTGVVPLVPVGTGLLLLGGRRNLVEGNRVFGNYTVGVAVTLPADGSTLATCPFAGADVFDPAAQAQLTALAGEAAVAAWIKHPHAPKPGYTRLELYKP